MNTLLKVLFPLILSFWAKTVGQYLYNSLKAEANVDVVFVWNRTKTVLIDQVPPSLILSELESLGDLQVDLIVEVAHPDISHKV